MTLNMAIIKAGLRKDTASSVVLEEDLADITATLSGDHAAYGRIVERYQPQIFSQMWKFTRDQNDQEDLVQDTFIEVFKSLKRFKGTAPLLHWTRSIATRVGYRYWKKKKKESQLKEAISDEHLSALSADDFRCPTEAAVCLHGILTKLNPKDRLVLTLYYFEDCDAKEIAKRMGWSANLVRVQMHRARKKLKALLEQQDTEGN